MPKKSRSRKTSRKSRKSKVSKASRSSRTSKQRGSGGRGAALKPFTDLNKKVWKKLKDLGIAVKPPTKVAKLMAKYRKQSGASDAVESNK